MKPKCLKCDKNASGGRLWKDFDILICIDCYQSYKKYRRKRLRDFTIIDSIESEIEDLLKNYGLYLGGITMKGKEQEINRFCEEVGSLSNRFGLEVI